MSMIDDLPEMLNTGEVARVLRKSEASIRRMCAAGDFSAVKIGRAWLIPKDDVRRMLEPVHLAGGRQVSREAIRAVVPEDGSPRTSETRQAGGRLSPRVIG